MSAGQPPRPKPILRYFGGKFRLAPWIIAHFPRHDIYVEPFAGGGSVFFAKEPAPRGETLNDLDHEIINLFRLLRGPQADDLIKAVALTPWSRAEFQLAHLMADDPLERARRLVVRSHMSHGTLATRPDPARGFRIDGTSGSTVVAREWARLPEALERAARRLLAATIECRDAVDLIADFNDPKVLIYLDPPYVHETRSAKRLRGQPYHAYQHELDEAQHHRLLDAAEASRAMVVISGYSCELYRARLAGWTRVDKAALSHRQQQRVESLWLNPAVARALSDGPLFNRLAIGPSVRPVIDQEADSPHPEDARQ